ncbi:ParA family protein [Microbacterium sp. LRZ72]|uniref:ParA family protein n=1 Tax=Microbacterium sp. LRZ72 TaxID=2942481 RepID=UPI0029B57092|nr:ParA family protein [Microbacterium sp. LRZ72]MDX2375322.1 ParA family protein [Microbacterium sp. LRZ72]
MSARVIAVYSTKGGVGKTTTAVNLAWSAAARGQRVLLWDMDPQAAATWLLGVKQKVRGGADSLVRGEKSAAKAVRESSVADVDVLPADDSYRDLALSLDAAKKSSTQVSLVLKTLRKDYDVIILDCPPGASLVAENAVRAADVVALPLVPAPLALRSLDQVSELVADAARKTPIVGFLTQVDRRKGGHRSAVEELPGRDSRVSDIVVPATVIVERMGQQRAPLGAYAPRSEAAQAYDALWERLSRS